MTNQQLKAHCEDVIANPQDHLDWEVDMARVALASLEAVPVAWVVHGHGGDQLTDDGDYVANVEGMYGARATSLYTAPPEAELKPIELPPKAPDDLHRVLGGYEKWLIATTFRDTWNACRDEVLRLNGVKS